MRQVIITVTNSSKKIEKVQLATSFYDRLIGLMFTEVSEAKVTIIKPCNSIHTFFMNYPIDVHFIDKENKVIKSIMKMKPWRMTRFFYGAKAVVEIPSSLDIQLKEGDVISYV